MYRVNPPRGVSTFVSQFHASVVDARLWWPRRPLATLDRKPRQGRKAATVSVDAGAEVSRRGHRHFRASHGNPKVRSANFGPQARISDSRGFAAPPCQVGSAPARMQANGEIKKNASVPSMAMRHRSPDDPARPSLAERSWPRAAMSRKRGHSPRGFAAPPCQGGSTPANDSAKAEHGASPSSRARRGTCLIPPLFAPEDDTTTFSEHRARGHCGGE